MKIEIENFKNSRMKSWLAICCIILFAFSCTSKCEIDIEKPNDVMPIDWDNYNDVYTVFWNYLKNDCSGSGYPTGDMIKIYGIIDSNNTSVSNSGFVLKDEHEHEYNDVFDHLYRFGGYSAPLVAVSVFCSSSELQKMLASSELTRRCYIKGEISTRILTYDKRPRPDKCCFSVLGIYLRNIDDIYFETDKNDNDE